MGYDDPDIYSDPQKFGLEILGEMEFGGGYDYDTLLFLRSTETGKFYYDSDSRCSCNSPFDGHTMEHLTELHALSDFLTVVDSAIDDERSYSTSRVPRFINDKIKLMDRLRDAGLR